MLTAEDALRPAVTGGAAVRACACREGRPIATPHQSVEVAQETALDRREHATGEQEVFQAGEEILRPGLIGSGEERLGEPLGHGIRLGGIAGLRGVSLSLLLLQVTPMAALALLTRANAVGTRWGIRPVFQPVKTGGEDADRGRLEGRKASNLRQARMGAQVVGPLRQTVVVEEEHQEEGAEHTDGIGGGAPAWTWGIERTAHGPGRVQSEPEEDECGLVPRRRKATGLTTEPALELGRQGGALLGRRWDQRCFLLGRKGKPRFDYGLIVPPSQASGKAPGIF